VAAQTGRLLQTAEVMATLDVLAALAELAASRQYARPELCDEPVLDIADGRHPVLDQVCCRPARSYPMTWRWGRRRACSC